MRRNQQSERAAKFDNKMMKPSVLSNISRSSPLRNDFNNANPPEQIPLPRGSNESLVYSLMSIYRSSLCFFPDLSYLSICRFIADFSSEAIICLRFSFRHIYLHSAFELKSGQLFGYNSSPFSGLLIKYYDKN